MHDLLGGLDMEALLLVSPVSLLEDIHVLFGPSFGILRLARLVH